MAKHDWFVISNTFLPFRKSLMCCSWTCIHFNHQVSFDACFVDPFRVLALWWWWWWFSAHFIILQIYRVSFPSVFWIWAVPCFIMLSLVQIRLCVVSTGVRDILWLLFQRLTVTDSCMLMWGSVSPAMLPLKRSCLIRPWISSQTPCEVHFPLRAKVKVLPVPSPLCRGLRLNQVIMWKEAVICQ